MALLPTTPSEKATLRQYMATFTVTLCMMGVGAMCGWPSPILPQLEDTGAFLHLDHPQVSCVVSLLYLGNLISPIPGGLLMDRFGRKRSLIYLSVLSLSSWTLILIARCPAHLYIARFLSGLWVGAVTTITPIYIGEIAEPRIRGALGNLASLMTYSGDLFICLVGQYVSYSTLAVVAGCVPLVFLVTFSSMPESPYYLLMHGHKDQARESLHWLRGDNAKADLEAEMNQIENNMRQRTQDKRRISDIFTNYANRRAFLIVVVLAVCIKFSGTSVIMAFASTTLPKDAFKDFGPSECVIVLGFTWVCSAILSIQLVDRLGRKFLLLVSSFGCGCAMLLAGTWFYLDQATSIDVSSVKWVPFCCFILHALLYSLGLGPIGMAIKGEVLATNIKATVSAISIMVVASCAIFLNRVYLLIADSIGVFVNYWMFATACFVACVFTVFVVVETKGRTLQEIQDELARKEHPKRNVCNEENL